MPVVGITKQDRRGLVAALAGGAQIAFAVRTPASSAILALCGAAVFLAGLLRIRFQ